MLSIRQLVIAVLLPLMFGAIILAGLQQMRTNYLDLYQEDAHQDIKQEARHITIGVNSDGATVSPNVAREQFRDLVIYSQISAVNCQLLYWIHGQVKSGQDHIGGERLSEYKPGWQQPSKIAQNSRKKIKYSIPGRPNEDYSQLFNYLERANYVPTCVGTSNAISSIVVDRRTQALRRGDLLSIAFEFTLGSLIGGVQDLWNAANCKQEPSWLSNRGNDMEGRYGKITFDSEVTFFPSKNTGSRIWSAQFLNDVGACPLDNAEFLGPEFFQAGEWMDYLPYPQGDETPKELNYGINGQSPPFNEHQSAESDAIIDAPAITTADVDGSGEDGLGTYGDWPRQDVWYAICEGASGYVQTNGNTIINEGEAVWGKNNNIVGEYKGYESRVFTFIRVTENRTSCLENVRSGATRNIDVQGELRDETCGSIADANEEKTVEYWGDTYECVLRKYRWNYEGGRGGDHPVLKHIYEIGWVNKDA